MNSPTRLFCYLLLAAFSALVILVPTEAFASKVTIAVGDIEYRAKDSSENKRYRAYGRGVREDTRAFGDMLTTALVKTRKFNVIERDRLDEIFKEQGLSLKGFTTGGYTGRKFNLQGVHYIMTGAITEYGQKSSALRLKGFALGGKTVKMAVDIRVLNVSTGAIEIAETVEASASAGGGFRVRGFASGGQGDSSAALGEVSRKTARNVANLIVSTVFPVKVVAKTRRGTVILNYGNGFLKKGDVLEIFSMGEVLIDPDTKEKLGSEEELVGRVAVTSAQAKFSKAKIIQEVSPIEKGMVARLKKQAPLEEKIVSPPFGSEN